MFISIRRREKTTEEKLVRTSKYVEKNVSLWYGFLSFGFGSRSGNFFNSEPDPYFKVEVKIFRYLIWIHIQLKYGFKKKDVFFIAEISIKINK